MCIYLNVAKDFSDALGGRYRKDGAFSGEEFYENYLLPRFEKALEKNTALIVNLDSVWGFPTCFIYESFGKLSIQFGKKKVHSNLKFISLDEPLLIKEIHSVIEDTSSHRRKVM